MPTLQQQNDLVRLWTSPQTFATSLLVLAFDSWGQEFLSWTPDAILMEAEDLIDGPLPQANLDRLMVAVQLLTTDSFYNDPQDFIDFCNVLSGDTYDPAVWDAADALEIAWGITEAIIIEPPDNGNPFTPEIRAYIGATLDHEGISNPPDVLQIALRTNPRYSPDQFSDDPGLHSLINDAATARTAAIHQALVGRLHALSLQLEQLPLQRGDAKAFTSKLLSQFSTPEEA